MSPVLLTSTMVNWGVFIRVLFLISLSWAMIREESSSVNHQTSSKFTGNFYKPAQALIEITIEGSGLCENPLNPMINPIVAVYEKNLLTKKYKSKPDFTTEVITSDCNPLFLAKYQARYIFEENQIIKFEVYDDSVAKYNLIGASNGEFSLASILQKSDTGVTVEVIKLDTNDNKIKVVGYLHITGEDVESVHDMVTVVFSGHNMIEDELNDPYLIISKPSDKNISVFTDVISTKPSSALRWGVNMTIQNLCKADAHNSIKIALWEKGRKSATASLTTRLCNLMNPNNTFPLNPENSGFLQVDYLKIDQFYAFTSYIQDGLQMKCSVAIDFTSLNSEHDEWNSSHHRRNKEMNDYETTIDKIVPIILELDFHKHIPVYGFGAEDELGDQIMPFTMNCDPSNPQCGQVEDVLKAYRNCVSRIKFSGPSNFAPLIDNQAAFIRQQLKKGKQPLTYFVLLILTDGRISDMELTKRAIINASELPLSIIIVGIGDANFGPMEELDGDEYNDLTDSSDRNIRRGIVHFVPFNRYKNYLNSAVLSEIPKQFSTYMEMINHPPQSKTHQLESSSYGEIIKRYAPLESVPGEIGWNETDLEIGSGKSAWWKIGSFWNGIGWNRRWFLNYENLSSKTN